MFIQDAATPLSVSPECLGYGALISLLVSAVRGLGIVKKNPKLISIVLNVLWVAIPAFVRGGADFKIISFCVLTQFAASVATYEAVTKPAKNNLIAPMEDHP